MSLRSVMPPSLSPDPGPVCKTWSLPPAGNQDPRARLRQRHCLWLGYFLWLAGQLDDDDGLG